MLSYLQTIIPKSSETHLKKNNHLNRPFGALFVAFNVLDLYLDPSQHASGGHAEVQVGQHLGCGWFVDMRRPFPGKIIWADTKEGLVRLFTGSEFQTLLLDTDTYFAYNVTSILTNF